MIFLKLGGSLITNKAQPHTLRSAVLDRLAQEIRAAVNENPGLKLVIGHGSGSFGHVPAQQYQTRQGVHNAGEWQGFVRVWQEARALNQFVLDAFARAKLPVMAFPPSACAVSNDGQITAWNLAPLRASLFAGLIPVVNGDVIFDAQLGGTIVSTEDVFVYLAKDLAPQRILIAGVEQGVYTNYPEHQDVIPEITPTNLAEIKQQLQGAEAVDVTGGMLTKVQQMVSLVQEVPEVEVLIFSGNIPGVLQQALLGSHPGTKIHR